MSISLDRVWYQGLQFKLGRMRISGNLSSLLKIFLSNRLQRVVPNGQCPGWSSVLAGVPQGTILGPLKYLSDNLQPRVKLFADDTLLFPTVYDPKRISHPYITFNTVLAARTTCQKHFDLYLDHINAKISKANKGIEITKKLSNTFP